METKLSPGMWCKPENWIEWCAVRTLADSKGMGSDLGIGMKVTDLYTKRPALMLGGLREIHPAHPSGAAHLGGQEVSVLEFIQRMYGYIGTDKDDSTMSNPTFEVVTGPIDEPVKMSFTLDPNASPDGLTFSFALEYMRFGRKVTRASWLLHKNLSIDMKNHRVVGEHGHAVDLFSEDLLAMDWMVLPRE